MENAQKKKDEQNKDTESKEKTDDNSDINQNLENREKGKEKNKEDKKDIIKDKIGDVSFIKQNEEDGKNFLWNSFLDSDILKLTNQIQDITKNACKKRKI